MKTYRLPQINSSSRSRDCSSLLKTFYSDLSHNHTALVLFFYIFVLSVLVFFAGSYSSTQLLKCWSCQGLSILIYSLFLGDMFHMTLNSMDELVTQRLPKDIMSKCELLIPLSLIMCSFPNVPHPSKSHCHLLTSLSKNPKASLSASAVYILHLNWWQSLLHLSLSCISDVCISGVDIGIN